jgi:hypothetical protein
MPVLSMAGFHIYSMYVYRATSIVVAGNISVSLLLNKYCHRLAPYASKYIYCTEINEYTVTERSYTCYLV